PQNRRGLRYQRSLNLLIWRDGMNIRRGEIYLATLDPIVGREISKTRPVIIASNDKNNEFAGTVTVLPITSKNIHRIYPFEAFLEKGAANLPKDSKVKADQIRTLDKSRIVTLIGKLGKREVRKIEKAMKIHLGLS
ncbi:MAG: type II toxin-antitoxin system PemK/MazF family toxin, partial [Pseudomonadota bacterium]